MRSWSKFATWTLSSLMVINIVGTGYYFLLKNQLAKTRNPPVIEMESAFPSFSGVDVRGAKWRAGSVPCRVIRITDDDCSYCKRDKPSYAKVLDAARNASCEIIELAPKAGKMADDPRPGIVQLKYVDADVGSVLAPFATPQTVIVDGNWKLKWNRRGALTDKALASSIAILNSISAAQAQVME